MKLIIDVPNAIYQRYLKDEWDLGDADVVRNRLRNGIPLPKGHGRILDEKDIFDPKNNAGGWYDLTDMSEYILGIKAIIEADKEKEQ